jgi:hypothetical protein
VLRADDCCLLWLKLDWLDAYGLEWRWIGQDWMAAITNRIEQDRSVTCIGCQWIIIDWIMDIDPLPGLLPSKVYVYVRKKFILLSLSCPLCPLNKPRTVFILGSLYFSKLFHLVQSTLLRFHFFVSPCMY